MDKLVYTSLSGLRGTMTRQQATAHNMANVNTPGFKADISANSTVWVSGSGHNSRAMASGQVLTFDDRAGPVSHTGRPLDIALQGDALIAVQSENGDQAYTRRGDLMVSANGMLVTNGGAPVFGDNGPIIVPPSKDIRIDESGVVSTVPADSTDGVAIPVDRIKLVSPGGARIEKGLDGLFRPFAGGTLPADPLARVIPESLEGSNVNMSEALTDMIESSRLWEMQLNVITSARDMDSSASNLMNLPQ